MMWNVLKQKKEVISVIMGEKDYDEDAVLGIMADQMLNDYGFED